MGEIAVVDIIKFAQILQKMKLSESGCPGFKDLQDVI
jgi:hypothetical protein